MMPATADQPVDDDSYVARMLATQGLGARVSRPPSSVPKPNTRFLRHIIRETDNHNASLKRKEERKSKERMRKREVSENTATYASSREQRRRHRVDDRDMDERREGHRPHRRHRSRSSSTERDRSRRHRRRHEDYGSDDRKRRHSGRERRDGHERRQERSRSRSPRYERGSRGHRDRDSDRDRDHHRLSPCHSTSPRRSRSPERPRDLLNKEDFRRNGHRRDSHRGHTRPKEPSPRHARGQSPGNESDPLEDIVGPLPFKEGHEAIRSRGRGSYRANPSNIDAHFALDYDPTLDVHLDDDAGHDRPTRRHVPGLMTEDDDWELALEALRDRTRWRQKGEERLREAGFNESTVERWKSNPAFIGGDSEGRVEDVKWATMGESREWDRGKVVTDQGVDLQSQW